MANLTLKFNEAQHWRTSIPKMYSYRTKEQDSRQFHLLLKDSHLVEFIPDKVARHWNGNFSCTKQPCSTDYNQKQMNIYLPVQGILQFLPMKTCCSFSPNIMMTNKQPKVLVRTFQKCCFKPGQIKTGHFKEQNWCIRMINSEIYVIQGLFVYVTIKFSAILTPYIIHHHDKLPINF